MLKLHSGRATAKVCFQHDSLTNVLHQSACRYNIDSNLAGCDILLMYDGEPDLCKFHKFLLAAALYILLYDRGAAGFRMRFSKATYT